MSDRTGVLALLVSLGELEQPTEAVRQRLAGPGVAYAVVTDVVLADPTADELARHLVDVLPAGEAFARLGEAAADRPEQAGAVSGPPGHLTVAVPHGRLRFTGRGPGWKFEPTGRPSVTLRLQQVAGAGRGMGPSDPDSTTWYLCERGHVVERPVGSRDQRCRKRLGDGSECDGALDLL